MARLAALALVFLAAACGRQIGDDCEINVQCDPQGNRQCDLSQPGGYCTVEGCSRTSCPDDALCVRFFPPEALGDMCNPRTETVDRTCTARAVCLPQGNAQTSDTNGYCVDSRLEVRFCMKPCGSDGDCRDGYECRSTGTNGAALLPDDNDHVGVGKFCIERTQPHPDAAPLPPDGPRPPADAAVDAPVDAPEAPDAGA